MAAHDPSWEIFRAELKRWMDLRRCTNKALAEAINADLPSTGLSSPIDEQIIKRWRHSTSPPLMTLKVIGRILAMSADPAGRAPYDPTYLPRTMGILDEAPENTELIEAAYRLQTIRARIADAQSTLVSVTSDEGVINIVRAATRSGLGAAVLPVHEGPHGYPMHVSDRIDLRHPMTGSAAPDPADHPFVADALHDAFAVVSRRTPRFCGQPDPSVAAGQSSWAVQYLARPRSSIVHRAHVPLPAIAITSVTTTAWPDDIGDLVALVLGYGFTTTRELARELVADPYAAEGVRRDIHDNFLCAATPTRRVWTHHGTALPADDNELSPFRDSLGRVTPGVVQVLLVEDDALLTHAANNPPGRPRERGDADVEADLLRFRAARDTLVARAGVLADDPHVITLPVTHRDGPEERWEQVFHRTLDILVALRGLGVDARLDEVHERLLRLDPQVTPQVLRWLADHEAPYVDQRYRTTR